MQLEHHCFVPMYAKVLDKFLHARSLNTNILMQLTIRIFRFVSDSHINSNPKEILYYALKKMHQPILAKELKSKYGGSQGNNIVFHKYC